MFGCVLTWSYRFVFTLGNLLIWFGLCLLIAWLADFVGWSLALFPLVGYLLRWDCVYFDCLPGLLGF